MVNRHSCHPLRPPDDQGPAVESLCSASVGEVFVAGDAGYDGALTRARLIARSRSLRHVLSAVVGQGLVRLLARLRAVRHPWWELRDDLLTDIGKTRGDAEVEKLRHRPIVRDPHELTAQDIRLKFNS